MRDWLRTPLALWDAWRRRHQDAPKGYTWREAEFLSSVMEVEEAPPAPLARVLLWSLVAMLMGAMAWAYLGKLDIVAEARGKIRPVDEVKVVQAAILGKVARIAVRDGSRVVAGDVLIELGQGEVAAEGDRLAGAIANARLVGAMSGLLREVAHSKVVASPTLLTLSALGDLPADKLAEMQLLLEARHRELLSQLSQKDAEWHALETLRQAEKRQRGHTDRSLRRQLERGEIELRTRRVEIASQREGVRLLKAKHARNVSLHDRGLVSKSDIDQARLEMIGGRRQLESLLGGAELMRADAARERGRLEAELDRQGGRIVELGARQVRVVRDRELLRAKFQREMTDGWLEAVERLRELESELAKHGEVLARHVIRAPVTGVVEQLGVHVVGAVVQAAQALLVVVPADARLQAEVMVENKDVGYLVVGQEVALKLDAFPHTRHGLVRGELLDIADDAVEVEGVGLVYMARIGLLTQEVEVNGRAVALTPGMSVTAEVRTGERGLYEFFLEPLLHHGEQALDER